jgi:hypothetical protein
MIARVKVDSTALHLAWEKGLMTNACRDPANNAWRNRPAGAIGFNHHDARDCPVNLPTVVRVPARFMPGWMGKVFRRKKHGRLTVFFVVIRIIAFMPPAVFCLLTTL